MSHLKIHVAASANAAGLAPSANECHGGEGAREVMAWRRMSPGGAATITKSLERGAGRQKQTRYFHSISKLTVWVKILQSNANTHFVPTVYANKQILNKYFCIPWVGVTVAYKWYM